MNRPIWKGPQGEVVACVEKIKVMNENLDELTQFAQDAFEDGILMGVDPVQLKKYLVDLMQALENPYQN